MIDSNTLTGLFGGSLATLIVKEFLNQINKRQDFTRELKKFTYIKKLEKAENAIAYYWTYLNKVVEMKKALEFVIKVINEMDEKDYDIEIIQQNLYNSGLALKQLTDTQYSNINSIHLYFDLEDMDKWNDQDLENLLTSLSETKSIDNDIKFWMDLYNNAHKVNDVKKSEIYWNAAIELLPVYVKSLQNFIDGIEKNKYAIEGMVQKIKEDFKLY